MQWFNKKDKDFPEIDDISTDEPYTLSPDENFQVMVDIVKNYDKREFNKVVEALTYIWEGYHLYASQKTIEEKEIEKNENKEEVDAIADELLEGGK